MPVGLRAATAGRGYGARHQATRRGLEPFVLAGGVNCARCGEPIAPTDEWHLGHTDDRSGYSGPEHARCNTSAGAVKSHRGRWQAPPLAEPEPERAGVTADDRRWRRPWLEELLDVPADAVWPRFMTVPHPQATGSLGPEFIRAAEARDGRPLRWWQRLVATRLLETDVDGRLVWETLLLTMARQLGKSWLLRELLLWRMHQTDLFGEPQDVLHTGKDLMVCKEVMRPALIWADNRPEYKISRGAGQMQIEHVEAQSRWLLRAKSSVYGYSVSVGAVDEAWKVMPEIIDEGLEPTMVEREQSQLWLISTAHRQATALMLAKRKAALDQLETGDGDLLIEWSTSKSGDLDDVAGWRAASPHWTAKRERLIRRKLEAALSGEGDVVEDEADPVEAFRAQWLNQWPDRIIPIGPGEQLLPAGLWAHLAEPGVHGDGPLFVAVEDDYGDGAAVAAAAVLDDGRIEVAGWTRDDWDSAIEDVDRLGGVRRVRLLLVGASLLSRVPPGTVPAPKPAGSQETRLGLPLLRDLAAGEILCHDTDTDELDQAVNAAQVKELSAGLMLVPAASTHLVKALVWAVNAAHRPVPMPAVY